MSYEPDCFFICWLWFYFLLCQVACNNLRKNQKEILFPMLIPLWMMNTIFAKTISRGKQHDNTATAAALDEDETCERRGLFTG